MIWIMLGEAASEVKLKYENVKHDVLLRYMLTKKNLSSP